MGDAEAADREEVERRGGWEELVGARWRPGLLVDVVEVVALDSVRRESRAYCWGVCCCCGGGAAYIWPTGPGEVEFVIVRAYGSEAYCEAYCCD